METKLQHTPEELAAQLRCPSGDEAGAFGVRMYESNRNMIDKTIAFLELPVRAKVLELGFGNGSHIAELFERYHVEKYEGLEISEAMITSAAALNKDKLAYGTVVLDVLEDHVLAKPSNTFDVCFSINTLYFWEDLTHYMNELYRMLKPGGHLLLTFIAKESAEKMSFTNYGFRLYGIDELTERYKQAGFKHINQTTFVENAISKNGESVTRHFTVMRGMKV